MQAGTIAALASVAWFASGLVLHYLLFARPRKNYDPLGFALALLPGPFVALAAFQERRDKQAEREGRQFSSYRGPFENLF